MDSIDQQVLQSAIDWHAAGRQVWLATVVRTWGSSPRPVGALWVMADDGRHAGSVSGGCIEDDLMAALREGRLAARRPDLASYGVSAEESRRFGLPCGGTIEVVVEPLTETDTLAEALQAVRSRRLVTRTLQLATGRTAITGGTDDAELSFDGMRLVQVFGSNWRLLLIGAGQIASYLAPMAQALDYHVLLCDPREESQLLPRIAGVDYLAGMPDDVVVEIKPDARTAVVALSHDPKLDDLALIEALKSHAFYVGAVGSIRNSRLRRERLVEFDLSPSQLARLYGPVGLPIGSRTPPEIAIATIAEITAVRRGVADRFSSLRKKVLTLEAAADEVCPALARG